MRRSFHKKILITGLLLAIGIAAVVAGWWIRSPQLPSKVAHLPPALLEKEHIESFKPEPLKLQEVFTGREQIYFGPTPTFSALTLVHYWATWCGPCEKELPQFLELSTRFSQVTFVVISVDDDLSEVRRFAQKYLKKPLRSHVYFLYDPSGESAAKWGSLKLPETYVLSPTGVVFDKFEGPQSWLEPRYLTYLGQLQSIFP